MGTNYYLYDRPACETCGRDFERLHIGKASWGWCFSLQTYPDDCIDDLRHWIERWWRLGATIKNEYGETVAPNDMKNIITQRRGKHEDWDHDDWCGYQNEAHFHERNHSERGPNGLVRHKVDGMHCVGHGAGTWDLMRGEFS
jgi:hypothetical protein